MKRRKLSFLLILIFIPFLASCGEPEEKKANEHVVDQKIDKRSDEGSKRVGKQQPKAALSGQDDKAENEISEVDKKIENEKKAIKKPAGVLPSSIKDKVVIIDPPQPTDDPTKIEVLGFFAYSCGHCYNFHTNYLPKWEKPDDVVYRSVPLVYGASVKVVTRAYYTAESLQIENEYHHELFSEYRKDRMKYQEPEAAAELATKFGISKQQFLATYNSMPVNMKFNLAGDLARAYGIRSVPTMVVNGKYKIRASSHKETVTVLEELMKIEREAMNKE